LVAGIEIPRYLDDLKSSYGNLPPKMYLEAVAIEEAFKHDLLTRDGKENVHRLHDELAEVMVQNVTVKRNNKDLQKTIDFIKDLRERYGRISLDDKGTLVNQTYAFANQFASMLELALVMTKGALLRNEFRGSHYKPEFPERDDVHWLKTTIAEYDPKLDEPVISYIPVDTRHAKPVMRDYTSTKKTKSHLENIPANIVLPI
jgi:succinate dehydrogenase / fumarate reductase flavoprotein subunit